MADAWCTSESKTYFSPMMTMTHYVITSDGDSAFIFQVLDILTHRPAAIQQNSTTLSRLRSRISAGSKPEKATAAQSDADFSINCVHLP